MLLALLACVATSDDTALDTNDSSDSADTADTSDTGVAATMDCGAWFPYHRFGSTWSWSQDPDIYPNDWVITAQGPLPELGDNMVQVTRQGTALPINTEGQTWSETQVLRCDDDGIWMVEVEYQQTTTQDGVESSTHTRTQYGDPWLVWPKELEVGTVWQRTYTAWVTDLAGNDPDQTYSADDTLEIVGTLDVSVPAGEFPGALELALPYGATTVQVTLAEGAGALQVVPFSELTDYALE